MHRYLALNRTDIWAYSPNNKPPGRNQPPWQNDQPSTSILRWGFHGQLDNRQVPGRAVSCTCPRVLERMLTSPLANYRRLTTHICLGLPPNIRPIPTSMGCSPFQLRCMMRLPCSRQGLIIINRIFNNINLCSRRLNPHITSKHRNLTNVLHVAAEDGAMGAVALQLLPRVRTRGMSKRSRWRQMPSPHGRRAPNSPRPWPQLQASFALATATCHGRHHHSQWIPRKRMKMARPPAHAQGHHMPIPGNRRNRAALMIAKEFVPQKSSPWPRL